jgi:hypothetical protein
MTSSLHQAISDYTQCPCCALECPLLSEGASGNGYADSYYNCYDQLWAICSKHSTRWYVSRALLHPDIPNLYSHPRSLIRVKPIFKEVIPNAQQLQYCTGLRGSR